MTKYFINLDSYQYLNDRIFYRFTSNLDVFKTHTLFIHYSQSLPKNIESISLIPFLAVMAPIAWLTGAEITMPEIDEAYLESIEGVESVYREWYPRWSFQHTIKAKPVRNTFQTSQEGLFFSLGLDSLTSYIKHRQSKPILFTVLGMAVSLEHKDYFKAFKEQVEIFKNQENVQCIYIKTNIGRLIDPVKLVKKWGWIGSEWWGPVAHGMCLSALTAPISYEYLKNIYIASSFMREVIWGSTKKTDNLLRWAGTQVSHDNSEYDRLSKIKHQFKPHPELFPHLLVCIKKSTRNCLTCDKCVGTILGLLVHNIDPTTCGFDMTPKTLTQIKRRMQYDMFFDKCPYIQKALDLSQIVDLHGSKEFFQWFKKRTISKKKGKLFKLINFFRCQMEYKYNRNFWVKCVHHCFKRGYKFFVNKLLLRI